MQGKIFIILFLFCLILNAHALTQTSETYNSYTSVLPAAGNVSSENYLSVFLLRDSISQNISSENYGQAIGSALLLVEIIPESLEEIEPSETPLASSSSGGGGIIIESIDDLYVDTNDIVVYLVLNSSKQRVIKLKNIDDENGKVIVSQKNLDRIVSFDKTSFELSPNESADLIVTFSAFEDPGIYAGKILINDEIIFVLCNINLKELLFDATIFISEKNKQIFGDENLEAEVSLIPIGSEDLRFDVTLNYVIKDFDGKTYLMESETFLVEGSKSFKKEFYTKNLSPGHYVVNMEMLYPGGVAVSSSHFEVISGFEKGFEFYLIFVVILAAFLFLAVLAIKYKKRKSFDLRKSRS